jgi:hypothetical protein
MNGNQGEEKLSGILCGVSGEYFVAAELSRLGFIASITLKNTKGVDILATNESASKSVAIQVKTNQGAGKAWVLHKKAEEYFGDKLFYVFVNLKDKTSRPDFYIVPSRVVADQIREGHAKWLRTPGKKGQPHNDSTMRKFSDERDNYLGKWDILGL